MCTYHADTHATSPTHTPQEREGPHPPPRPAPPLPRPINPGQGGRPPDTREGGITFGSAETNNRESMRTSLLAAAGEEQYGKSLLSSLIKRPLSGSQETEESKEKKEEGEGREEDQEGRGGGGSSL